MHMSSFFYKYTINPLQANVFVRWQHFLCDMPTFALKICIILAIETLIHLILNVTAAMAICNLIASRLQVLFF